MEVRNRLVSAPLFGRERTTPNGVGMVKGRTNRLAALAGFDVRSKYRCLAAGLCAARNNFGHWKGFTLSKEQPYAEQVPVVEIKRSRLDATGTWMARKVCWY